MTETPQARRAAEVFAALAHPKRVEIMECLIQGDKAVGDLQACRRLVGVEQSNLSQHLAVLRHAGLVTTRRDGNRVIYRAASARVRQLLLAATRVRK